MLTGEQIIQPSRAPTFEEQYLLVRRIEQRLYSDEIVRKLPIMHNTHPHAVEWKQRSRSAGRLLNYLSGSKNGSLLEIGCGCGWLSNLIAVETNQDVTATDINSPELVQARRLFNRDNLEFILADCNEGIPGEKLFDFIVLAASIQYFSSLPAILDNCIERLTPAGEIHILDTRFYKASAIPEARERTRLYYQSLGSPRMVSHYFHHSFEELKQYKPAFLYNPFSLINRLNGSQHEFPWIRISKSNQRQ